uniref:LIM zinc-binding domain-containing protein n=1 Tax=Heligmosomoides polygyrus TaxID=6339 RepID=A0A183F6U5_HELPZ
LSTISPYLVRVPRIAPELLENPETDAKSSHVEVKKEVYDFERTAIVPPLQSIPSANQVELKGRRLTDEFPGSEYNLKCCQCGAACIGVNGPGKEEITRTFSCPKQRWRFEPEPFYRQLFPRDSSQKFPVTRLRRGCERVYSKPEDEWKSSKDTTDPIHVGPPSYQHSVVVLDEDDKVMNSELRSRDAGEPRNVGLSPPHSAAPDSNFASEHVPLNREVRESASGRANLYGDNAPLGVASKPASFVEQRTPPLRDSWLPPPSLRQLSREYCMS